MLEMSGVNQESLAYGNSRILTLKRLEDDSGLAQIIQQRGMQDMTTTIADFEQQIMERGFQKGFQKGFQEGMLEKTHEFARLMLGDGEPEREVRRYTDLSSEKIRQIKREIENSRG